MLRYDLKNSSPEAYDGFCFVKRQDKTYRIPPGYHEMKGELSSFEAYEGAYFVKRQNKTYRIPPGYLEKKRDN